MKLEIMEKYFQIESMEQLHNEFKIDFYDLVEDTLTVDEVSIIKNYYEDRRYVKIRVMIEDEVYVSKDKMIRAIAQSNKVIDHVQEFAKWQKLDTMFSEFMDIKYDLEN